MQHTMYILNFITAHNKIDFPRHHFTHRHTATRTVRVADTVPVLFPDTRCFHMAQTQTLRPQHLYEGITYIDMMHSTSDWHTENETKPAKPTTMARQRFPHA